MIYLPNEKFFLITVIIIFLLALSGIYLIGKGNNKFYSKNEFSENDARKIAEKLCIKGGKVIGQGIYNENSKTWWFDADLNSTREGCNPACVVSEETKTVEINWRCTGLKN